MFKSIVISATVPFVVSAMIASASLPAAAAQEAALYEKPLPKGAVFLRWIGTDQAPEALKLAHTPTGEAFRPLAPQHLDGAEPGRYYSVLPTPDGAVAIVQEPERGPKSKVHLTLLNASGQSVRLVVAGQNGATGAEVIQQTDAFASGGRLVNPVSAKLAVVGDDGSAVGEVAVRLRRGQNVTVLVTDQTVRLIENTIGPLLEE